jgi:hypothetical protein
MKILGSDSNSNYIVLLSRVELNQLTPQPVHTLRSQVDIDLKPILQIVSTLENLSHIKSNTENALRQVTYISDTLYTLHAAIDTLMSESTNTVATTRQVDL